MFIGLLHWAMSRPSIAEECAYLWSMWKLDDRSATRLAVGEEPLAGLRAK